MKLPRLYLITGAAPSERAWRSAFEAMLGVPDAFIQLRLIEPERSVPLLEWAVARCRAAARQVLVNGPAELAERLGAGGVHLKSGLLSELPARPLGAGRLVGVSCHDLAELRRAQELGADFACLSPVNSTKSHPSRPPLGMDRFRAWSRAADIPVFALGGMTANDLGKVVEAGGYGVAGISGWWKVPGESGQA